MSIITRSYDSIMAIYSPLLTFVPISYFASFVDVWLDLANDYLFLGLNRDAQDCFECATAYSDLAVQKARGL
ncbi:hypothetical protein [Shewanella violacea]|uniref:Uncharacterized protein n=1 Tax=Shewanella violacea (strain JCM 10179 / CIP 106290 / LMG 19151 / DSS12) TaxID=637905 RepID=D4ZKG9_SHEVD|nr:hypothetical protein [Shewanella violacea]BAJ02168.1 hypothetical protein SVI_2197 [Shewanella violacea DSS12]